MPVKFMFRYQLHFSMQQFRKRLREWQTLAKQIITTGKIHQEINVTVRALLAASDRAENPDAPSAIPVRQGGDGFFSGV